MKRRNAIIMFVVYAVLCGVYPAIQRDPKPIDEGTVRDVRGVMSQRAYGQAMLCLKAEERIQRGRRKQDHER